MNAPQPETEKPVPGQFTEMTEDDMNTPRLETERLILRRFTENDIEALFLILKDREVNTFLPWFPLKSMDEASSVYETEYAANYEKSQAWAYAICLKEDNAPIGYMKVDVDEGHDFGYGLRKEFWRRGLVTEAGKAVIAQVKKDGLPYVTATHDINNPRSGGVMRRVGMKYQYSYEEQWQPKDLLVTFRMYQLNFAENAPRVFRKYWDNSAVHFIETGIQETSVGPPEERQKDRPSRRMPKGPVFHFCHENSCEAAMPNSQKLYQQAKCAD